MKRFAKKLAAELFKEFGGELLSSVAAAEGRVWFLGRDCDVFAAALRQFFPEKVRYLTGLNRKNAAKLQHRHKLVLWLKSCGVHAGDTLIDTGYAGTIFRRIREDSPEFSSSINMLLLTADPDDHTGQPISPAAVCYYGTPRRQKIIALEHCPKREEILWDEKRRVPKVKRTGDPRAHEFFNEFVKTWVRLSEEFLAGRQPD